MNKLQSMGVRHEQLENGLYDSPGFDAIRSADEKHSEVLMDKAQVKVAKGLFVSLGTHYVLWDRVCCQGVCLGDSMH